MAYWRITRDTANVGEDADMNRRGVEGPRGCTKVNTPIAFRLVTDDWPEERAAYYGVAADEDSVELALDGFGTPDYGMTAAHIYENGKWEDFIG